MITSGGEYKGILTKKLIKGLSVNGKQGLIKDVMDENVEAIDPEMTLFDAYKKMQ